MGDLSGGNSLPLQSKVSPERYAGCSAAIRDMALLDRLHEIGVPTLVVIGTKDISTPPAGNGELLLAEIGGAKLAQVSGAHIFPMEAPEEVAAVLADHFG